jgi:hypothetical protein
MSFALQYDMVACSQLKRPYAEAAPAEYELTLFVDGPRNESRRHTMKVTDRVLVGRDASCDLILDSSYVSRHHLEIIIDEDECGVRSFGINGTRINDYHCHHDSVCGLTPQDRLQIGPFCVRVILTKTNVASPVEEDTVIILFSEHWRESRCSLKRPVSKTARRRSKNNLISLCSHRN